MDNNCTQCSEYRNNWIKYTAITFLPLTFLYIVIFVLNLDTTRTILSSYILFGQILTAPITATLYEFNTPQCNIIECNYNIWYWTLVVRSTSLFASTLACPHSPGLLYPLFLILLTTSLSHSMTITD